MISLSIFETLFFIILASSFILILFLVYHFKSRIYDLEKRCDKLFAIVQSIAENMTNEHDFQQPQHIYTPIGSFPVQQETSQKSETKNVECNLNDPQISIHLLPNEDDSEDGSESDSQQSASSMEDLDDKITIPCIIKCNADTETLDADCSQTYSLTDFDEDDDKSINNSTQSCEQSYKKLPVLELRQLVISKGLASNTKKMKKQELIDLLTQA